MRGIKQSLIEKKIEMLNKRLGRPMTRFEPDTATSPARRVHRVGHFTLDHAATGYRLVEIVGETGGEAHPFGHNSCTLRELCSVLEAIHGLLDMQEWGDRTGKNWFNVHAEGR